MNVTTITMPKEEAEAKLAAYREQNRKRNDEEYQAAEAGYAALAAGTPLISLTEAIRGGGFDEKMRPKLAVARADREQVEFIWRYQSEDATFNAGSENASRMTETLFLTVNMGRRHGLMNVANNWGIDVRAYAIVPMVPADIREVVRVDLAQCFILWEVEKWVERRKKATPDRDPYLLKHIGGDLYAVLAEWDLTELERLVMAGRRDA